MGLITQKETTQCPQLTGSGFCRHTWTPGPVSKASLVLPCLDLVQLTVQLLRSQMASKSTLLLRRDTRSLDLQPALLAALREAELQLYLLTAESVLPIAKQSGEVWS